MTGTSGKKVLVVGNGGREHALCWKLAQSAHIDVIYSLPATPGIQQVDKVQAVEGVNVADFTSIVKWCECNHIDLVVVGPEDPLANGLGDVLAAADIPCFGPCRQGAQIEADKSWAKAFMKRHNIPTAEYESFTDADKAKEFIKSAPFDALVVKASGLAAGKGVIVAANTDEACAAVDDILGDRKFGQAGEVVVVEEKLTGEEVSVLAFVDSTTVRVMLPAQDHKRLKDGDIGPNTGGMGAYCPCPLITPAQLEFVRREVLQRAVDALRNEGVKYNGVLYAGMMLTPTGPKTLEFNCRFGDPETQVILPLLESDLYEVMEATCANRLADIELKFKSSTSAVGVVMASRGYPETSTKGDVIKGLELTSAKNPNQIVFHSGVAKNGDGEFVTNGGRVLINVVIGSALKTAAQVATAACRDITFQSGQQFRTDIARKGYKAPGQMSYKDSGVDIEAGDALVQRIKPLARGTDRPGVLGGIGSFGGMFRLNELKYTNKAGQTVKYSDPVLVQGTDGVGTKLKIAEHTGMWDTIGIDLVAMCANDVLCVGAEPFAFLDYIACGKLNVPTAALIVKGVSEGCRESKCALLGGETAEMPSIYEAGKYDLAGYCVGAVEHDQILPKLDRIQEGDLVIGLPSSGCHSNGYSLVNKIMETHGYRFEDPAPFSRTGQSYGKELLTPTRLYIADVLPLIRKQNVKAIAHITGGGLTENIPRVLPKQFAVTLDANAFEIPPVFGWLAAQSNASAEEMLKTFNCGIGLVIVVPNDDKHWEMLIKSGGARIGHVTKRMQPTDPQVTVANFEENLRRVAAPFTTEQAPVISYKDSGVDIVAGDSLVQRIKSHAKSTHRSGTMGGLGGFGGLFRLKEIKDRCGNSKVYQDPVLIIGTDGVGTKLKIAQEVGLHKTVGVDLVAMCANDILCNGAEPLTFLDYYACGRLDVDTATDVISGIADGCRQSHSVLLGGETAEMPGMYKPHVYDLAGFALGIVEASATLPRKDIGVGDVVIGLPSSGVHSNGFSLVHKILEAAGVKWTDVAPFSASGKTFAEEFLTPTRIYTSAVLPAIQSGYVKGAAHITGGGLPENIPRVLPEHLTVEMEGKLINMQPIYGWLAATANLSYVEMYKTFNCGVGMVLIVAEEHTEEVLGTLAGHSAAVIGRVRARKPNSPQCVLRKFAECIERVQRTLYSPKKRVGVLISGGGSNLQALIDATRNTEMGVGAEICCVISNKADAFGLERAKKAGIPSLFVNHKDFASREAFDAAVSAELMRQKVEIVCLAGFMRILSAEFVSTWRGRLINVHPALLPKHKGTHGQRQALLAGDSVAGCTVHFVDEGVDTGAIITQEFVPVHRNDTEETLSERILLVEHTAFPKALRLVATEMVSLGKNGEIVWNI